MSAIAKSTIAIIVNITTNPANNIAGLNMIINKIVIIDSNILYYLSYKHYVRYIQGSNLCLPRLTELPLFEYTLHTIYNELARKAHLQKSI